MSASVNDATFAQSMRPFGLDSVLFCERIYFVFRGETRRYDSFPGRTIGNDDGEKYTPNRSDTDVPGLIGTVLFVRQNEMGAFEEFRRREKVETSPNIGLVALGEVPFEVIIDVVGHTMIQLYVNNV
jgi:hypothetical protein